MNSHVCPARYRIAGPLTGLLAAMLVISMASPCAANIDFELAVWHGFDFYYGDASLDADGAETPITYHRVESPNAKIWQNTGSNTGGSSSTLSSTNDLGALLDEFTNGLWTVTLNVGDASEEQYTFSLALDGVTSNFFGDAVVTAPAEDSTIITNPPTIEWTGPGTMPSVSIRVNMSDFPYTYQDGATLPGTATSWTPGVVISEGEQTILVTYSTNVFAGATFSTPTNLVGGAALANWNANVDLRTYAYSGFIVPGGGDDFDAAVESPGLEWATGGDVDWMVQSNYTSEGDTALESGPVGFFEESWIEATIIGPGTLSFDWDILADSGDYFSLTVSNQYDEYEEFTVYGDEGGSYDYYDLYLDEGTNVLRWTFYNDDPSATNSDAAYLDNVQYAKEYDASLSLNLFRVVNGTNQYFQILPELSVYPEGTSYALESPNALSTDSDGSGNDSAHYATFQDMVDELEGGPWTMTFDPFAPNMVEHTFTIDASGLSSNDILPVVILNPPFGATGVATNVDFQWQGPAGYDTLVITDYDESHAIVGGASLSSSATNWMYNGSLPEGTNDVNITYTDYGYTGLNISWPEDGASNPIDYWDDNTKLTSYGRSEFVVGGGFTPLPVTILPPMVSGGDFVLSFLTQSGATHYVDWTTNLVDGPWLPATNFPGDGTTNMIPLEITNDVAFFRINTQ